MSGLTPTAAEETAQEDARWWRWLVRSWAVIGMAIVAYGLWWLFDDVVRIIVPPLALAGAVVYILNPGVRALASRGIPRSVGTAASYIVLIGIVVGLGSIVGPLLADQVSSFGDRLPEIAQSVEDTANSLLARFGLEDAISLGIEDGGLQESIAQFINENRDQITGLLRGAGSFASAVFHTVLTLVLAPIIAFYLLVDLPRLNEGIQQFIPPGRRSEILELTRRIGATVGAYFRGQLLVATFVAIATSIGLAIIGLPFWALVGVTTGVFNLVPLIGPFVGGSIGALIALTVGGGLTQAIWVVVVMTAVQQIDNHVITPNIVARTVKVHPATVILGLLVAGSLFGIVGMIIVIPAVAAIKLVALHLLVTRVPSMKHLAAEGPGLYGADLPQLTLEDFKPKMRRRRADRSRLDLEDQPITERFRRRRRQSSEGDGDT